MSNTKRDLYNTSSNFNKLPYDVIQLMAGTSSIEDAKGFLSKKETLALALANSTVRKNIYGYGYEDDRDKKITDNLLKAVACGMWRKETDENDKRSNIRRLEYTGGLFKHDLYAYDLLKKSPKYLFKLGTLIDSGERTFKNISLFKYALWAKKIDMIQGMVDCILRSKNSDDLKKEFLKQYKEVTKPVKEGGGIYYQYTDVVPDEYMELSDSSCRAVCLVKKPCTANWFDLRPLDEVSTSKIKEIMQRLQLEPEPNECCCLS